MNRILKAVFVVLLCMCISGCITPTSKTKFKKGQLVEIIASEQRGQIVRSYYTHPELADSDIYYVVRYTDGNGELTTINLHAFELKIVND